MGLHSDLQRIAQRNKQKAVKVMQNSLMRLGGAIVMRSPVDTGRFRSNWLSAYGAMDTSTNDALDKSGSAAIGKLTAKVNTLAAGQVFYFTNSLPYAQRLEYDAWSAQSPAGMVRVSVASWQSIVEDEIRKAAR
jgi:hypothetical protein